MITEPNVAALNRDREAVLESVREMHQFLDATATALAEPIAADTRVIIRGNLDWFLAVSSRMTKRIADYDSSVAGRVR